MYIFGQNRCDMTCLRRSILLIGNQKGSLYLIGNISAKMFSNCYVCLILVIPVHDTSFPFTPDLIMMNGRNGMRKPVLITNFSKIVQFFASDNILVWTNYPLCFPLEQQKNVQVFC